MGKKILFINDSASLSEIVQYYLEMNDFKVFLASNGFEGIEKAKEILPDLILLDVIMPGMDGFQVCKELKQNVATKEIPVLFLSCLTNSNDKIKGLELGAVDFITNTADQSELLARIETHLKIRELTQQLQASNDELMQKQRTLKEDLHAAGVIQQTLLPSNRAIPSPHIEYAWACQPSEQVGGDICNIVAIENNHYLISYVLDVSGHGVPSAMVTVSITQFLRQLQVESPLLPPDEVLTRLNEEYPFEKFNMFSTLFYMLLNTETGKLVYCNAGHPATVLLSPEKPYRLLESTGPMIGVEEKASFSKGKEMLQAGNKLILYSDGITEYRNEKGEFYGTERLHSLLEKHKNKTIHEIIELVSCSLAEFGNGSPPIDDISIMGITFK